MESAALGRGRGQGRPSGVERGAEDHGLHSVDIAYRRRQVAQAVAADVIYTGHDHAVHGRGRQFRRSAQRHPAPQLGHLGPQRLRLALALGHAVGQLGRGHSQRPGHVAYERLLAAQQGERVVAGDGLQPAHVGADRRFRSDVERPDVAQGPHMGAAAQLHRMAAGFEHPHQLSVLLPEEGDRADLPGMVEGGLVVAARLVAEHFGVDQVLHVGDLLRREGLVVAEVETETVGTDPRSLLLHVVAEHLAQRPVQDVGGGVVAPDAGPAIGVHRRGDLVPDSQLAVDGLDDVNVEVGHSVDGVDDPHPGPGRLAGDLAGVSDLTAALGVERRAVQYDPAVGGVQHPAGRRQLGPATELGGPCRREQRHERGHVVGRGH